MKRKHKIIWFPQDLQEFYPNITSIIAKFMPKKKKNEALSVS